MNQEQKLVLNLLKEIDEVCQEKGIPYFLSPRLTLNAYFDAGVPENPAFGLIFMKTKDMEAFRQAMSENLPPERALESMVSSPSFPGFYLRYENTATLFFHLNRGGNYLYPGIGIDICPLLAPKGSRKKRRMAHLWELGWKQTCDLYQERYTFKQSLATIPVRLCGLFGRRRLGGRIYRKLLKVNASHLTKGKYYVERDKRTYYPASLFDDARDIPLEGVLLKCPSDVTGYLTAHYGPDYARRLATSYTPSWALMASPRVRCQDFLDKAGDMEELIWRRRDLSLKDEIGRRCRKSIAAAWNYLKFLERGINLGARYKEKLGFLRNLKESRDYLRLESAFALYHEMVKESAEKGIRYLPDPELDEIYLDMLKNSGKAGFAEKIRKMETAKDVVSHFESP